LSTSGWLVNCADDRVRHCYPIVSNIICDYEEVCLICGIKSNQHCGKCQVTGSELGNLLGKYPLRTHDQMKERIIRQREMSADELEADKKDCVHDVMNFAWSLPYFDVHVGISMDLLHQIYKGVFRDMIGWVEQLLTRVKESEKEKSKNKQNGHKQPPGLVRLDAAFAAVPPFPNLKLFNHFSHVTQWTGDEERDLIRILVPVLTPLLLESSPHALSYIRALIDFTIIAQYKSHDDQSLRYLELALFRMECYQHAFAEYRPTDVDGQAHFNTPKRHSLTHYADFIKQFGALNGWDSEHMEAAHKYLLKVFYDLTNKNVGYLKQVASHNTRTTYMQAMANMLLHHFTTKSKLVDNITAEVTTMSATTIPLSKFNCPPIPANIWRQYVSEGLSLTYKTTTTARQAEIALGLNGFVPALTEFLQYIRQPRKAGTQRKPRSENVPTNIPSPADYPVQFFPSIRCWRRSGKDETNSEARETELLRCVPDWRGRGARQDHCWVQEYPHEDDSRPHNGKQVGQLRALIKVFDVGAPASELVWPRALGKNTEDGSRKTTFVPEHCIALVDVYQYKGDAEPHPVHGMIEVFGPSVPTAAAPRSLKGRRFYSLDTILRSAHVVPSFLPTAVPANPIFFINNYIDWDHYQDFYEKDWENKGIERARAAHRELHNLTVAAQNNILRSRGWVL
jgi:hypothetical protein